MEESFADVSLPSLISSWSTTVQHSYSKVDVGERSRLRILLVEAGIVDEFFETTSGEAYDVVGGAVIDVDDVIDHGVGSGEHDVGDFTAWFPVFFVRRRLARRGGNAALFSTADAT